MSLTDALQALADAHGPKALAQAHAALSGEVRRSRRASRKDLGPLAQTFVEAMRIWDQQKADGVSKEERLAGLEQTLRAAWPFAREWKFLCGGCGDTGLIMRECRGENGFCGRRKAHLPHEYGEPCSCAAGLKFLGKPKAEPTDYKQAGFTKVGKR